MKIIKYYFQLVSFFRLFWIRRRRIKISGWITRANKDVEIIAKVGDEAIKTGWDTNRYRHDVASWNQINDEND